jgi:hypothetical protein
MSNNNQRTSWRAYVPTLAVALPLLYVLSVGPVVACWFRFYGGSSSTMPQRTLVDRIYYPLDKLRSLINPSGEFDVLDWYWWKCHQFLFAIGRHSEDDVVDGIPARDNPVGTDSDPVTMASNAISEATDRTAF